MPMRDPRDDWRRFAEAAFFPYATCRPA